MAENYNLNSSFGFNVTPNKSNTANMRAVETKEQEQTDSNMFDTLTGYIKKYENVFSGNVEKEINMYSRQSMIVGMNLKAGEVKRRLDLNI